MEVETAVEWTPPSDKALPVDASNSDNLSPNSERKRRVRFPSDDVVTNYFEPPQLWPCDVSVPPPQVLLGRYVDACVRYNTRPLQKLTDQLLAVELVHNRWAPALSLRGEHLDPPQVESMEEILRWVRFRIFDISDTMLDDEGATALFDMLEFYDGVENLNISGQKQLSERGWAACARLIRRAASLQALYIRHCNLDSQALRHIGRALQLGGFLSEIHLERSSIGGAGLAHLVAGARTSSTLKRLHLSSCRLGPSDGTHLGILLRQSRTLEALDIEDNMFQDSGCMQILSGLAANRESKLIEIRLGINQLTAQAANAVAYSLVSSPLRILSLRKNNIGTEGVLAMRDGMLRCQLTCLDLSETRLSCEAAIALAEIAVESRTLETLDLRGNPIRTAGVMALGLAARMNHRLISIEIDRTRPVVKVNNDNAALAEELVALTLELDRQLSSNRQLQLQQGEEHQKHVPNAEAESVFETINSPEDHHLNNSSKDADLNSHSITVDALPGSPDDPIKQFFSDGVKLDEDDYVKPNGDSSETKSDEDDTGKPNAGSSETKSNEADTVEPNGDSSEKNSDEGDTVKPNAGSLETKSDEDGTVKPNGDSPESKLDEDNNLKFESDSSKSTILEVSTLKEDCDHAQGEGKNEEIEVSATSLPETVDDNNVNSDELNVPKFNTDEAAVASENDSKTDDLLPNGDTDDDIHHTDELDEQSCTTTTTTTTTTDNGNDNVDSLSSSSQVDKADELYCDSEASGEPLVATDNGEPS